MDVRCFAFYAIVFCYICLSSVTTGMTMLCTCTCISRMFLLLFMLHAEIYISLFKILRRRSLHVKIQSMSIWYVSWGDYFWESGVRHCSTTPSRALFSSAAATRSLSFNCLFTSLWLESLDSQFGLFILTCGFTLVGPWLNTDIHLETVGERTHQSHSDWETYIEAG